VFNDARRWPAAPRADGGAADAGNELPSKTAVMAAVPRIPAPANAVRVRCLWRCLR
jgi:hypothetical protein